MWKLPFLHSDFAFLSCQPFFSNFSNLDVFYATTPGCADLLQDVLPLAACVQQNVVSSNYPIPEVGIVSAWFIATWFVHYAFYFFKVSGAPVQNVLIAYLLWITVNKCKKRSRGFCSATSSSHCAVIWRKNWAAHDGDDGAQTSLRSDHFHIIVHVLTDPVLYSCTRPRRRRLQCWGIHVRPWSPHWSLKIKTSDGRFSALVMWPFSGSPHVAHTKLSYRHKQFSTQVT